MDATDFDGAFKLKAITAYQIVSQISDPYYSSVAERDEGFEILLSKDWFRPMAKQHLDEMADKERRIAEI